MVKYHVGIDVSKSNHKACIHNLALDSYSGVFSIAVSRQGFEKFEQNLRKLSDNKEDFVIGFEATGNYGITLAYFLLSQGYEMVEINPYRANQFRKAQGKKAKTDYIDARSLAALVALGNHKSLVISDPILDNLKELTRFRADMTKDRSALLNQLRETLSTLYPEFSYTLVRLDSPTCLTLLAVYPGPEFICRTGESALAAILTTASRGKIGKAIAKELITTAQNTVGALQKQPALSTKVSILAERILELGKSIQRVEEQIKDLFSKLPYKPSHFPVGDIPSLATLISEIDDIHRFTSLKQFLSHYGWCPQNHQSGNYNLQHPKMSHAGNGYVRRTIWMLSIVAIRIIPRYRDYFERRVKEGKAKMHILVAVGRKLLSVFYAILKKALPYDPNWEVNRQLALART
jgi:transposase